MIVGSLSSRRLGVTLIVALLAAALAWPGPGVVRAQEPQGGTPEWYENLPPAQPGFPVSVTGAYFYTGSSPTLVDLDGNGTREIVIGGRTRNGGQLGCGGVVYAYRHDGSVLWQRQVRAAINSTPTAADLTGDGHPDIVVGMGGYASGQCWDGGVIALNGLDGSVLWTFDTQDWLNHNPDGMLDGVFSTPAVGDVNGDGEVEIAFGAWDQCFYLLDKNGVPLWGNLPGILPQVYCGGHGFYNEDTFWSSPALADLTGDGLPEIITGADVYPGNVWGDPGGGYVYVFDAQGNALAREWLDQDIYSSPAAADLDNDGTLEIVVGTGTYWDGTGFYVSAYEYNQGGGDPTNRLGLMWRHPTDGRVFSSPAVADLDQNGVLDVVVTGSIGNDNPDGSYTYGLRGTDGSQIFRRRNCDYQGRSGNTQSSPVIADTDGDGYPEILFSHLWEIEILNHDGTYYTDYSNPQWPGGPVNSACQRNHTPTTVLTYYARYTLNATPAVADLDGDGDAEVVIGGHNPDNTNQGMLFVWTGHAVDDHASWPTFHQNERHTGLYVFDPYPPTNPTSLSSPSHSLSTWSANNHVQVLWSGAGDQGSGVAGYSIAWDTSPGTLPDKVLDLPADAGSATSPALVDGQSHYFHLRTADQAGNWAAGAIHLGPFWIDAGRPTSSAHSPALVTGSFPVTWSGQDGASGVLDYTVEVRQDTGAWTTWLQHVTSTSATYQQAMVGHTYRFRSIARDRAGNVETAFTNQGDTATIVVRSLVSGTVRDARGQPVSGAQLTAEPAAVNQALTDVEGHYVLGVQDDRSYEITAVAYGYGSLPARVVQVEDDISGIDFYLLPEDDAVQNGGFEAAGGWTVDGPVPPARVSGAGFTGDYALKIGELAGGLAGAPQTASTWSAGQTVSVPAVGGAVLAWTYRVEGSPSSHDQLRVIADGPDSDLTQTISLGAATWTHGWLDLRPQAGQQVTVRFVLTRDSPSGALTVWLDDVSAGLIPHRAYVPLVDRRKH